MLKINKPHTKNRKPPSDSIPFWAFIICLCLAVWSINIYRNTIIDWRLLIIPTVSGCITATLIFYKGLVQQIPQIWARLFICFICGGSLVHFSFLFSNQKFADRIIEKRIFEIIERGHLANTKGRSTPYALIKFDEQEKQLTFSYEEGNKIVNAKNIELEYQTGLLGFYVIRRKTLLY